MDIVRENQDLEFPDNVEYDFVYWSHVRKNYPTMLDAVKDCDIVAMENVGLCGEPHFGSAVECIRRALNNHNAVLRGDPGLNVKYHALKYRMNLLGDSRVAFTNHYAGSGKELHFIDAWEHSDDLSHITQLSVENVADILSFDYTDPYTTLTNCEASALYMSARESIILRQLAKIGNESVERFSGEETAHVGVVLGSGHSLVSVAAHALGARVKRNFLYDRSKSSTHAFNHLERTMRFHGLDSVEAQRLYRARYMARSAMADHYIPGGMESAEWQELMGDDARLERAWALLAMDLYKTECGGRSSAVIIRAYIEDKIGAHPLNLTDEDRTDLEQLYPRLIEGYVEKARKLNRA